MWWGSPLCFPLVRRSSARVAVATTDDPGAAGTSVLRVARAARPRHPPAGVVGCTARRSIVPEMFMQHAARASSSSHRRSQSAFTQRAGGLREEFRRLRSKAHAVVVGCAPAASYGGDAHADSVHPGHMRAHALDDVHSTGSSRRCALHASAAPVFARRKRVGRTRSRAISVNQGMMPQRN